MAKVPKTKVSGLESAVKANGNARVSSSIKNIAAVIVAIRQGNSLSPTPPEPSLNRILVKKTNVRAKPTMIITNISMPGAESRY